MKLTKNDPLNSTIIFNLPLKIAHNVKSLKTVFTFKIMYKNKKEKKQTSL